MTYEEAELVFAYQLALISSPSKDARTKRWEEYNSASHEYGPAFLSEEAFREAESTDFITSFVLGKVKNHTFRTITDDDVRAYYRENADLFTRAEGDPFAPEEVRDIIIKRLREREYRENVEAISLQHRDSQ